MKKYDVIKSSDRDRVSTRLTLSNAVINGRVSDYDNLKGRRETCKYHRNDVYASSYYNAYRNNERLDAINEEKEQKDDKR